MRRWAAAALLLAGLQLGAVEITVLAVSDVHGAWRTATGGWAQLATLLRRERAAAGADRVLMIDCGDELAGSWEMTRGRGEPGIAILNALQFDVWVLGNHDFEWGLAHLRRLIAGFHGRVLAGNWDGAAAVAIFERAGLRIAVIGLTTDTLDYYTLLPEGNPVIEDEAAALDRAMAQLRDEAVDVTILALHRGVYSRFGHLAEVVADYPQIDLILGGHSHVVDPGSRVAGIYFAAPGSHGGGLVRVALEFDPAVGRVTARRSQWVPVTPDTPEDAALVTLIESSCDWRDTAWPAVRTRPAVARAPKRRYASSWGALALRALATATAEEGAVMLYGVSTRKKTLAPEWSERKLYQLFPYQDWVVSFPVSAAELEVVLNEQLQVSNREPYQPVVAGLEVAVDGQWRIVRMTPERAAYRLFTTSFLAAGGGGQYPELHRITRDRAIGFHGLLRERAAAVLHGEPECDLTPVSWVSKAEDPAL